MVKRRIVAGALCLVLTAGFYLALIDTVSAPESYAGIGIVLLGLIAFDASRAQGLTEVLIGPRDLALVWRALTQVPSDVVLLCREAVAQPLAGRRARGEFRAIPFRGGGDDVDYYGRHALAELVGSISPNTIVLGVDPDRQLLLVHQLRRRADANSSTCWSSDERVGDRRRRARGGDRAVPDGGRAGERRRGPGGAGARQRAHDERVDAARRGTAPPAVHRPRDRRSILVDQSFSLIGDEALLTGALVAALSPVLTHATARSLRTRERGDWREGIERHREEGAE